MFPELRNGVRLLFIAAALLLIWIFFGSILFGLVKAILIIAVIIGAIIVVRKLRQGG